MPAESSKPARDGESQLVKEAPIPDCHIDSHDGTVAKLAIRIRIGFGKIADNIAADPAACAQNHCFCPDLVQFSLAHIRNKNTACRVWLTIMLNVYSG